MGYKVYCKNIRTNFAMWIIDETSKAMEQKFVSPQVSQTINNSWNRGQNLFNLSLNCEKLNCQTKLTKEGASLKV